MSAGSPTPEEKVDRVGDYETVGERFSGTISRFEDAEMAFGNEAGTELVPGAEVEVLSSAAGSALALQYAAEELADTLRRAERKARGWSA